MEPTFGEYVRQARENLGLTQVSLAQQLEISDVYVSRIETGRSLPARKLLRPLAEALQQPLDEMERCWLAQKSPETLGILLKHRPLGPTREPVRERAPVIGFIGADDRAPDFGDLELPAGAALEWLPRPDWAGERTFGLAVRGDSMRPLLHEGDLLLVDPERGGLANGDLVVVRGPEKRAYIKLWQQQGQMAILRSFNPVYEDLAFSLGEIDFAYKVIAVFKR